MTFEFGALVEARRRVATRLGLDPAVVERVFRAVIAASHELPR